MAIVTATCYISSCEKKYTIDALYHDKFVYCSGDCYQQSFDNSVVKYQQR